MRKKGLIIFLIVLAVFLAWSLLLYTISPEEIVDKIGLNNSYLILFIMAFLGGTSIFLPFPYYLFTISFGAAGLNPLFLGISAGLGTLIGDTTSYYIAYHARVVVPRKYYSVFQKILDWTTKKNPAIFSLFVFLYASIIPLPDDLITVPSGITKYPFWRLAIPLGLGKITFNILLALSGFYGWSFFFG
jgi:membrane protein YqaA with SNARE-associated domain